MSRGASLLVPPPRARGRGWCARHYLSNGKRAGRYLVVGDVHNTPGRSRYSCGSRNCPRGGPASGTDAAGPALSCRAAVRSFSSDSPVRTRQDMPASKTKSITIGANCSKLLPFRRWSGHRAWRGSEHQQQRQCHYPGFAARGRGLAESNRPAGCSSQPQYSADADHPSGVSPCG